MSVSTPSFAFFVTLPGDPRFWIILGLVLLTTLTLSKKARQCKKLVRLAAFICFQALPTAMIAFGGAALLQLLLKVPRPCHGLAGCPTSFSFPSAHTTVAFATFTLIGLSLTSRKKRVRLLSPGADMNCPQDPCHFRGGQFRKIGLFAASMVPAVLVAWSRMALGVHTPLDVFGGVALGTTVGTAAIIAWHNFKLEKLIFKQK